MTDPISPEQHRDRPRLIKSIRKGIQRFQIAVFLIAIVVMAMFVNFFMDMFGGNGAGDKFVSLETPNGQQTRSKEVVPKKEEQNLNKTPTPVIEVLIDNDSLLLMSVVDGKQKQSAISLKDLVEKAKQATGNSEGTKIRVLRKKSARKLTRTKLREALNKAVGVEAQRWPDSFAD